MYSFTYFNPILIILEWISYLIVKPLTVQPLSVIVNLEIMVIEFWGSHLLWYWPSSVHNPNCTSSILSLHSITVLPIWVIVSLRIIAMIAHSTLLRYPVLRPYSLMHVYVIEIANSFTKYVRIFELIPKTTGANSQNSSEQSATEVIW